MPNLHNQDFIIKLKQGPVSRIGDTATKNSAVAGEPAFTTDTKQLYMFDGTNFVRVPTADVNDKVLITATDMGGATNYIEITAGGELRLVGTATVWKDIDFPLVAKTTGANTPAYNTLQGNLQMLQWAVNDALQCDTEELIHEWKEGSTVTWHIHVVTGGTNVDNRYLRFEVEFTWANFGATLPANTTITSADMLIPAGTAALTHFIFDIGTWTPTGGKIGAHVKPRIKRVAAAGTAPTDGPFAELVQLHIECDSMGSKTTTAK